MILYIKQAGCEILHKGRILRTPVKLQIKKSEIDNYEKILKFKSIYNYEIINNEDKYENKSNINHRKILKNTKITKNPVNNLSILKPNIHTNKNIMSKSETKYHDTIESDISSVKIDIDNDDILKQLLANI